MQIIDLTLPLRPGMRGVEFETKYTVARDGWNARTLHLYSHAGTHMDAPVHFAAGPGTIDQTSLDRCLGRAWVADLSDHPDRQPIAVADLGDTADRVRPGDALLLRTGWSRYVDQPQRYRDDFAPIGEGLAEWIVARGVRLIGVEPPSVADVNDLAAVTRIHKTLLGADVLIVEGLTNLERLGQTCLFGATPLPIADGDGCPCRAFAISDLSDDDLAAARGDAERGQA